MIAAAYAATAFVGQAATNFVGGMTDSAPIGFLVPMLLILGLGSNIASAGMSLYNAALDMGSWPAFLRLKRWHIAAGLSAVVFGLTYLLTVATNFLSNLTAFVTIMVVTATPWVVIIGVNYLLNRGGYSPIELHAFAMPGQRGRYWYTGGVNLRAFAAWAIAVALGLMFSSTTLFTGPLVNSTSGVDLSWIVAGIVGGLFYLAFTFINRAPAPPADDELVVAMPEMSTTS